MFEFMSPKDNFPLPHIDLFVYNMARHCRLSFVKGYPRYNQLQTAKEDHENTMYIM